MIERLTSRSGISSLACQACAFAILCVTITTVVVASQESTTTQAPGANSDDSTLPSELQSVRNAWAQSRSQWSAGQSEWRIEKLLPDDARKNRRIEVRFDHDDFRLSSECRPTIRVNGPSGMGQTPMDLRLSTQDKLLLGKLPATINARESSWRTTWQNRQYLLALFSKFQTPAIIDPLQQYSLSLNSAGERHLWTGGDAIYSRAITGERGISIRELISPPLEYAMPRTPIDALLLEAIAMGVRPELPPAADDDSRFQLRHLQEAGLGRGSIEIEDRRYLGGIRKLWVDAERGHIVTRGILISPEQIVRAQYDLAYERQGERWRPIKIWVQILGGRTLDELPKVEELLQAMTVNCESWEFVASGPKTATDKVFPAGTWVCDQRQGRQYLVRQDGSERDLKKSELVAGISDEFLKSVGETPTPAVSSPRLQVAKSFWRLSVKWKALSVVSVVLFVTGSFFLLRQIRSGG